MKRYIALLLGVVLTVGLSSCASTPNTRIERNPGKFSQLPPYQQSLVEQGRIQKGMSKDGVYLAMGKPDRVSYGASQDGDFEEWNYYSLQPIVTNHFQNFWGWGCGRRGLLNNFGFGPTVSYVPRKSAQVNFVKEKVQSFRTVGQPL